MKKKIILSVLLLLSFSLIVSCKKSDQISHKINLPFDARPFSVNNTSFNESTLRKKLLHAIYMAQKVSEQADADKIVPEDFEDINDDVNYNYNFSKLIVSYADREELYYIPEGINKNDLLSALSLKLESGKSWVWKSDIKKRQTAYLIETSSTEVLVNEKLFSSTVTNSLSEIYPFQIIEISLQVAMATPTFSSVAKRSHIPNCRDYESPDVCYCEYAKTIPNGSYSSFSNISKPSVTGTWSSNQTSQPLTFQLQNNILKTVVSADVAQTEKKVFKIEFPSSEGFQFVSVPNNCGRWIPNEAFNLANQFQYKMEFKVIGASETLETFGAMPTQI